MIKMQFKLTDIVETMGSNNASSLRQSAWSKMQAAMVRVKPAFALVLSFYSSLGSPVWHEDDSFTHLCTHVTDFSVTNDIPHETMSKFVDSNIFGLFTVDMSRKACVLRRRRLPKADRIRLLQGNGQPAVN